MNMNIIAVDDENHALRSLTKTIQTVLPDAGISGFTSAGAALDYARQNRIDVAFLDIEMGGMDGLELAKHLADIYNKTDVVFVTGYEQYAINAIALHPAGYLLKPVTENCLREAMDNLRHTVTPAADKADKNVRIQTFGNFEVFIGGKALYFPRAKSKEVLAYLVHKNGTSCTMRELSAELEEKKINNIKKYVSDMRKTLEDAGIGSLVIKKYNNAAVDTSKFDCDLYRFLEADGEALKRYTGEYMAQYSWAEYMTGYLDMKAKDALQYSVTSNE